MLALIFMGCIQNRTRAIRGFGKSDSDVSDDMIPPLFRGHCFQITFCNLVPCSPCLGPYALLATVPPKVFWEPSHGEAAEGGQGE